MKCIAFCIVKKLIERLISLTSSWITPHASSNILLLQIILFLNSKSSFPSQTRLLCATFRFLMRFLFNALWNGSYLLHSWVTFMIIGFVFCEEREQPFLAIHINFQQKTQKLCLVELMLSIFTQKKEHNILFKFWIIWRRKIFPIMYYTRK